MVERLPVKERVVGSNPTRGAKRAYTKIIRSKMNKKPQTFRDVLSEIETTSRSTVEKGERFEHLTAQTLEGLPEYEIKKVYSWSEWPDREKTGLSAQDIGIDLVAIRNDGKQIAIQCKYFQEDNKVRKENIDSFLGAS